MKYDLNLSLTTPPAEPPTEPPTKQLTIGETIPRPPSRKHSSTHVPTLSTPFEALPTPPAERPRSRSPVYDVPPAARSSSGTPLCTIHEDAKLRISARDWLMGKPWRGGEEEVEEGRGEDVKKTVNGGGGEDVKAAKDVKTPKEAKTPKEVDTPKEVKTPKGDSGKDVKTSKEKPRQPRKPSKSCDAQADQVEKRGHGWCLPPGGVGERFINGVMCVDPAIEEAMRNSWPPVVNKESAEDGMVKKIEREEREGSGRVRGDMLRRGRERREERQRREKEEEREREEAREEERERGEGGGEEDGEGDREGETERKDESWWKGARRKLSGKGSGSAGSSPGANASAETPGETPEEANEYTPSRAASPDMIVEARARAAAAPARKTPKHISAAEKARELVENEPHSPGWNGSTYVDGREHHYCGPDFPCQMEPQCNPSIRDLWEKGVPVTPDLTPKRAPFGAPVRALLGIKKQPWPPEPKYRKPACVQSIRIGNTADTTIIDEPQEGSSMGSFAVEADRVLTPDGRGGAAKAESSTMRRLRKFWGFWTYDGGKMGGSRRPVIVTSSLENLVVAEPNQGITASRAAANFAASACYPVGESTVETAKPIKRVDSGTQTPE